jgi:hypothetical protein
MNFLNKLKAHVGGLVRLKTQLYWYDSGLVDGVKGRICLLLDASQSGGSSPAYHARADSLGALYSNTPAALLFIDGSPKWVKVYKEDVELIK